MVKFDLAHEFAAMHVGVRISAAPLAEICFLPRAVGANGIGGFGHHGEGFHLEIKRWLLRHERVPI